MNTKFKLLDAIALLKVRDNLVIGQVGTIVEILDDENFEVEFSDTKGETIATAPVNAKDMLLLHYEVEAA
ncbi:MAG: DUF4926 domain-containing protein [Ignavibacteria bacterium]|nr:DUF4926 domain-containing protein [Ignavibacteria bacterium]